MAMSSGRSHKAAPLTVAKGEHDGRAGFLDGVIKPMQDFLKRKKVAQTLFADFGGHLHHVGAVTHKGSYSMGWHVQWKQPSALEMENRSQFGTVLLIGQSFVSAVTAVSDPTSCLLHYLGGLPPGCQHPAP